MEIHDGRGAAPPEMSAQVSARIAQPLALDSGGGSDGGTITTDTPIVLAPMAGVTNSAFRRLCRESAASTGFDPGLYVAEMVTARSLVERNPTALRIVTFDDDERPRSAQVYGVDPATTAAAIRIICEEDRADHIDLNFGCPVPKVTRKGGGGALPWKIGLFRDIVRASCRTASEYGRPLTVKIREGIDDEHLTYLDAGRAAEDEGVAAITLHARTVAMRYSGQARWESIAALKRAVDVPVLGNGDVFSADDATAMIEQTGCDGVVVGRGCQGRPWLFTDLAAALHGQTVRVRPSLAEVAAIIYRHGQLNVEHFDGDEGRGVRDLRKHMAWYLKGYPVGGERRHALATVSTLAQLRERLAELGDAPYPDAADGPRGRQGSPKAPHLPHGWLDSRELSDEWRKRVAEAEEAVEGG